MNWIISGNHKVYKHKSAFQKWGFIDWKQGNYSYKPGDTVFIYSTFPYQTIQYKTIVKETDKNSLEIVNDEEFWIDKSMYTKSLSEKYMRLVLLEEYNLEKLKLSFLMENGLKSAPQGPQKIKKQLKEYIDAVTKNGNNLYPEVLPNENFYEGSKMTISINKYERNPIARQKCINYYGCDCQVCGLNFEKEFGKIGKNFIHVHHIKPLAEIGKYYKVDPIKDLRPVCPNCHAMIHRGLLTTF